MTIFIVVLLTPRKNQALYLDTIIELPPTHKPYPAFEDHLVSVLGREYLYKLKDQKNVNHEMDLRRAGSSSPCLSSSYSAACYKNEPYEELKPRQVHFPRKQYYL